jgi:hypothetical protein
MNKVTRLLVWVMVLVACGSLVAAYLLTEHKAQEFWSDFLLHVVAEFSGLAIAIVVAYKYASKRLDDFAPAIVKLVQQLRAEKRISTESARQCVICAAQVISEGHIRKARPTLSILSKEAVCAVCENKAEIREGKAGGMICSYCHLPRSVWGMDVTVGKEEKPVV